MLLSSGAMSERREASTRVPAAGDEGGGKELLSRRGTPDDLPDSVLLRRVAGRDQVAFRQLVARHLSSVLGIARRMLRDDAEADDVAQEAMLRLWQSAGELELGPAGARPWLRRVASNLCLDRIRAGRRTEVTDTVPEQEVAPEQLTGLEGADVSARVEAALKTLPDRQRLALTLFHYEGLSQVEVGEVLGVSDEAVESLLARARRGLRSMLKDDWRARLGQDA
jgi:RNA polymerase sigma-70 factor, ECF subfamily